MRSPHVIDLRSAKPHGSGAGSTSDIHRTQRQTAGNRLRYSKRTHRNEAVMRNNNFQHEKEALQANPKVRTKRDWRNLGLVINLKSFFKTSGTGLLWLLRLPLLILKLLKWILLSPIRALDALLDVLLKLVKSIPIAIWIILKTLFNYLARGLRNFHAKPVELWGRTFTIFAGVALLLMLPIKLFQPAKELVSNPGQVLGASTSAFKYLGLADSLKGYAPVAKVAA